MVHASSHLTIPLVYTVLKEELAITAPVKYFSDCTTRLSWWTVCVCVCAKERVNVYARETERERERVYVCQCVCVCVCVAAVMLSN